MRVTIKKIVSGKVFKSSIYLLLVCFVSCEQVAKSPPINDVESSKSKVIYGSDDRFDLFRVNPTENNLTSDALAVTLLVKKEKIADYQLDNNHVLLESKPLYQDSNVCTNEPFAKQPTAGYCTGFLVEEDIVVTAGHCIKDLEDCSDTLFVFDFAYITPQSDPTVVKKSNLYSCKRVLLSEHEYITNVDFAIVQLDRSVRNRPALRIASEESELIPGDLLTIIGHPSGLPLKVALGPDSKVRRNVLDKSFFVATLDSFYGNSGSPVINTQTGFLEGILVRGEKDFELVDNECKATKRCDVNDCRGEDVMKIREVAPYFPGNYPTKDNSIDKKFTQTLDSVEIPDNDPEGVMVSIQVEENRTVKDLFISIEGEHKYPIDLKVEITAPDGESYILKPTIKKKESKYKLNIGFDNNLTYGVHRFWNKSTYGAWQVKLLDTLNGDIGTVSVMELTLRMNK